MPLTPADVANVAFNKPSIGRRGYNEDEVDAFLDLLETELARLIEENNDLRHQVEDLEQQQRAAPVPTGPDVVPVEPPGPVMAPVLLPSMVQQALPGGDHNVHSARVLGLAQLMADQLTGEAEAEADTMVGEARAKAEQLLSEARAMADGLVNEARARAETMLGDARSRAEAMERRSREKAAALESEAARKHTETISELSQEKSALQKRIEDLRAWEREYRVRLKA